MNENIPTELNLDQNWSIGEQSFVHIKALLASMNAHRIVEFGSGRSSVRLALLFPESEIISFEDRKESFFDTQKLKEKFASQAKLEVRYKPLKYQWIKGGLYLTYRNIDIKDSIDAVIIDGPPHMNITRRGREACLYAVYDKLRVGGIVILDDYQRVAENQIVRNWISTFGNSIELFFVESGHRLAVLRKVKELRPNWFSSERLKDNWMLLAKRIVKYIFNIFNK